MLSSITLSGAYDSSVNFEFGFVFPTSTTGTEFIGELVVPVANKWAGLALGPGMVGNLLIMGWPYNGGFVSSARFATAYAYPSPYYGPTITTLPYSKTNSTHWTWVFRCQNCTCKLVRE
jgi:cellobiose dehydrogenase (acceptor)